MFRWHYRTVFTSSEVLCCKGKAPWMTEYAPGSAQNKTLVYKVTFQKGRTAQISTPPARPLLSVFFVKTSFKWKGDTSLRKCNTSVYRYWQICKSYTVDCFLWIKFLFPCLQLYSSCEIALTLFYQTPFWKCELKLKYGTSKLFFTLEFWNKPGTLAQFLNNLIGSIRSLRTFTYITYIL